MVYKVFPETMEKANYTKLDQNLPAPEAVSAIVTISENSRREIIEYMDVVSAGLHYSTWSRLPAILPSKDEKELLL